MGIEKLENQSGILRIVLALQDGELTISQLMKQGEINQVPAYHSVEKLVKLGWVKDEKRKDLMMSAHAGPARSMVGRGKSQKPKSLNRSSHIHITTEEWSLKKRTMEPWNGKLSIR